MGRQSRPQIPTAMKMSWLVTKTTSQKNAASVNP